LNFILIVNDTIKNQIFLQIYSSVKLMKLIKLWLIFLIQRFELENHYINFNHCLQTQNKNTKMTSISKLIKPEPVVQTQLIFYLPGFIEHGKVDLVESCITSYK